MTHDIETHSLVKNYGSLRALAGVDLKVPSGSLFGLVGPNGAGKTTLFSLLANFIKPSAGVVRLLGHSTSEYHRVYGQVGVLPQDALLFKNRTLVSQLDYLARLCGLGAREARREAEMVLDQVGLGDKMNAKAGNLSHGMGKRLGIAQTLLGQPRIILLDEPIAGLDPQLAKSIRDLITSLKRDRTIVISSHDLREIQEICDDVAMIHKGELKAQGSLGEVVDQHNLVFYRLENKPDMQIFSDMPFIVEVRYDDERNELGVKYHHEELSLSELNAKVLSLLIEKNIGIEAIRSGVSLEEQFLKMIRGDRHSNE